MWILCKLEANLETTMVCYSPPFELCKFVKETNRQFKVFNNFERYCLYRTESVTFVPKAPKITILEVKMDSSI